jgi:protein SCO1/2
MRTAINVLIILAAALVIGLVLRPYRQGTLENAQVIPATDLESELAGDVVVVDDQGPIAEEELPEGWLRDFQLTERSGREVTSGSLLGQPYVVSFFFSTCPSVCVMQNQKVQQLQTAFAGQPIRFVAISVDPTVDTPEKLREYADRYKADPEQWLFLTGDLLHIRRVGGEMYRVAVDEKFHTEKFILVDADGKVKDYYTWTEPRQFEKLKADIESMLSKEKGAT